MQFRRAKALAAGMVSIALAYAAFAHAAANVLEGPQSAVAIRLVESHSAALASRADQVAQLGGPRAAKRAEQLARRALASSLLSARAFRVLATLERERGDEQRADAFLDVAERIRPREIGVNVTRLQLAAQNGDAEGFYKYLGRALKTNRKSWELLFPVATAALKERALSDGMLQLLSRDEPWVPHFVSHVIQNDPTAHSQIAELLLRMEESPDDANFEQLYRQLVASLEGQAEWDLVLRTQRMRSRLSEKASLAFDAQNTNDAYVPLTWQLTKNSEIVARTETVNPSRKQHLIVNSRRPGVAARKLLDLAPGSYLLSASSRWGKEGRAAALWEVYCLSEKSVALASRVELSPLNPTASSSFNLGRNCPFQIVALRTSGERATFEIQEFSLSAR